MTSRPKTQRLTHYIKRPKRSKSVTVCIAARCFPTDTTDSFVVTVSDTKLTTGIYSIEMATLKLRHLTKRWRCLIAGKFAQHRPLLERISDLLGGNTLPSCTELTKVCTDAFIAENKRLVEESLLRPHGLTMDEFVKCRAELGETLYERLWGEIGRIKLGCDLIVCGFDPDRESHIFIVSNPTEENPSFITDCDFPGFGAIGTGSYLADSTLYALGQNPTNSLAVTIYNTLRAKFLSESASDVGESTYMHVFDGAGNTVAVDPALEDNLRGLWASEESVIPDDSFEMITEAIPESAKSKSPD